MRNPIIKPEQESEIAELYADKKYTALQISEFYGCSIAPILSVLHKYNIPRNKCSSLKYSIDEYAFDNTNDPNVAYWLGFIYAEGCISKSDSPVYNLLSVQLDILDVEHLYKFKYFLSAENPVHIYNRKAGNFRGIPCKKQDRVYCDFRIFNPHITSQLINTGIIKDRNQSYKLDQTISNTVFRHWLRGYIDGDGYIGKNNPRITITGQPELLIWIKSRMKDNLGLTYDYPIRYNHTRVVGSIMYNGRYLSHNICDWLYRDTNVFMERKKQNYLSWK
jgi:hypothetical protein